jgi:hypothetical protein
MRSCRTGALTPGGRHFVRWGLRAVLPLVGTGFGLPREAEDSTKCSGRTVATMVRRVMRAKGSGWSDDRGGDQG